jgi:NAD dependent epimerase/dehydratase family enzyme
VALKVPTFALKLALGEMAQEMLLSSQRVSPISALQAGFEFRFPLLRQALADILGPGTRPAGGDHQGESRAATH